MVDMEISFHSQKKKKKIGTKKQLSEGDRKIRIRIPHTDRNLCKFFYFLSYKRPDITKEKKNKEKKEIARKKEKTKSVRIRSMPRSSLAFSSSNRVGNKSGPNN